MVREPCVVAPSAPDERVGSTIDGSAFSCERIDWRALSLRVWVSAGWGLGEGARVLRHEGARVHWKFMSSSSLVEGRSNAQRMRMKKNGVYRKVFGSAAYWNESVQQVGRPHNGARLTVMASPTAQIVIRIPTGRVRHQYRTLPFRRTNETHQSARSTGPVWSTRSLCFADKRISVCRR
jgi:hypothetical protein